MAKRRIEPFNPWPSFVDLFASVIMVILMFMLILIVNITYYAQFKYKVSYTGTVAIEQTVIKPVDILDKKTKEQEPLAEKKESVIEEKTLKIVKDTTKKELEAVAGIDLSMTDNNFTRQENIFYENWMAIKYLDNEVILDPKSIKDIDKFLLSIKEKFPQHSVWIYIKEPQNQISASVGKQLALSRVLNIRNLLRKREYKDEDVVIKFRDKIPQQNTIEHPSGYAIIAVRGKKQ
jgi:hypothetical protein